MANLSREIKFRGKTLSGEWVYGYYVVDPKGGHRIYWKPFEEATSNTYHLVIPESVGEWTGLKDKNGKDIYEGDIVQRGIIIFGNGKFQGYYYDSGGIAECWEDDMYQEKDIEVRGNAFESPEFLKEE